MRKLLATLVALVVLASACAGDPEPTTLEEIDVYDFDGIPDVVRSTGRPLVINFFAETCAPCVTEMPDFEAVYQEVRGEVDFRGISEDVTTAAARRIVDITGISYRAVWDGDGTALRQFEVGLLPTTVFVAADGTIERVHLGQLSADALRAEVDALLLAG